MNADLKTKLQWSYSAQNTEELKNKYDEWATEYDKLGENNIGWIGPNKTVEYLKKYVASNGLILDAGAGTGLVGDVLQQEGYQNLIGIDISAGMMAEALKKNIYQDYQLMDLTKALNFEAEKFDAVIIAGVFTHGHVGAEVIENLIPAVKKEGYLVFTIRQDYYELSGFEKKVNLFVDNNQIVLIEKTNLYQAFKHEEILHHIEVYQILDY